MLGISPLLFKVLNIGRKDCRSLKQSVAHRECEDLICERRSIVNKMGGILATLGVKGSRPCSVTGASN